MAILLLLLLLGCCAHSALSAPGDEHWDNRFGIFGLSDSVNTIATAGDISYFGGNFRPEGGVSANYITSWNGKRYVALGRGVNGPVSKIATDGKNIFVGGSFSDASGINANNIAKWDGTKWSALGTGVNGHVAAVAIIGSDIYVGGSFTVAGGQTANAIAKWDGTKWSGLRSGIKGSVSQIATDGKNIFVGGEFTEAGGIAANNVAKWDGSNWFALGEGIDGPALALALAGESLYVGGAFKTAGGRKANNIGKWNGSAWSALGDGLDSTVRAIAVSGNTVYVGGDFNVAGGNVDGVVANYFARWDGKLWYSFGLGMNARVRAIETTANGIFVGGDFTAADKIPVRRITLYGNGMWNPLIFRTIRVTSETDRVTSLAFFNGELYAAYYGFLEPGFFRWNGDAFVPLGKKTETGFLPVSCGNLLVRGTNLYATGYFGTWYSVGEWNGTTWRDLNADFKDPNQAVSALTFIRRELYAASKYSFAKYDGSSWTRLPGVSGQSSIYFPHISALAADGTYVYAGGSFANAGDVSARNIAKWDGQKWSAMGQGLRGIFDDVTCIAVAPNGDVYAGGDINGGIARWDGQSWSIVGGGIVKVPGSSPNVVYAMAFSGSDLYVAGQFIQAGSALATGIAKWDGQKWSALGSGLDSTAYGQAGVTAYGLAVSGSDVYVGGWFNTAGGKFSFGIAHWNRLLIHAIFERRSV